jgi:hypothetical protein
MRLQKKGMEEFSKLMEIITGYTLSPSFCFILEIPNPSRVLEIAAKDFTG